MPQRGASTRFHIVCSDQPRNGKTLVARLLCDYLILARRAPLIFDAAPAPGGLRGYFPARAVKVELSSTSGQMAVFDRALAQAQDCVLDLPAHLLNDVVDLMRHIGFGETATTPGLELVLLFVADRNVDSLLAGRKLRGLLRPQRFILVRNEAIALAELDRLARFLHDGLGKQGRLTIPRLDDAVLAAVEDRMFSFKRFVEELPKRPPGMAPHIREAIEDLLGSVFHQFEALGLGDDGQPRVTAIAARPSA